MLHIADGFRFINALPPAANNFASTVYPAGVNIAGIGRLAFIIQKGVGTTGTTTVTVLAADDASHTNSSAIPFTYRRIASNNTTIGAVTVATSTGFTTTAGSSDLYVIEVDAQALAATGYKYAFLKMVESAASAVLGGVIAFGTDLRYADDTSDVVA